MASRKALDSLLAVLMTLAHAATMSFCAVFVRLSSLSQFGVTSHTVAKRLQYPPWLPIDEERLGVWCPKQLVSALLQGNFVRATTTITRGALSGFVWNRVEDKHKVAVKAHLHGWYAEAANAEWKPSAEFSIARG